MREAGKCGECCGRLCEAEEWLHAFVDPAYRLVDRTRTAIMRTALIVLQAWISGLRNPKRKGFAAVRRPKRSSTEIMPASTQTRLRGGFFVRGIGSVWC